MTAFKHGCYFIPKSDIDIFAMTTAPVTKPQAKNTLEAINHLNDRRPHTGSLELSIVKELK